MVLYKNKHAKIQPNHQICHADSEYRANCFISCVKTGEIIYEISHKSKSCFISNLQTSDGFCRQHIATDLMIFVLKRIPWNYQVVLNPISKGYCPQTELEKFYKNFRYGLLGQKEIQFMSSEKYYEMFVYNK